MTGAHPPILIGPCCVLEGMRPRSRLDKVRPVAYNQDALFEAPKSPLSTYDPELESVAEAILRLDPRGSRIAGAIRLSIDMLLNGQYTGRYRWDQLYKTEKTHCGTLVEINLQREFDFEGGIDLDYKIAGVDVDCKYSQDLWGWMIPPEAVGKLCLVVWANDKESVWCAGLVRAEEAVLSGGGNRDQKRQLTKVGRNAVHWLFWQEPLPPNILLQLPEKSIEGIFEQTSGAARLDQLFRLAQRMRISRTVVATVAQQDDFMKRVRYNGGSRSHLRPEGIVIFGHYRSHQKAAGQLGLPVPERGESVSAWLARYVPERHGLDTPRVELDGAAWVLGSEGDIVENAPLVPETRSL